MNKGSVVLCLLLACAAALGAQQAGEKQSGSIVLHAAGGIGSGMFVAAGGEYVMRDLFSFVPASVSLGTTVQAVFVPNSRVDYTGLGVGVMGTTHYRFERLQQLEFFLGLGFGFVYYLDYDESATSSRTSIVFATEAGAAYSLTRALSVFAGFSGYWGEFACGMAGVRFKL